MSGVRKTAVAGLFYPADRDVLWQMVRGFMEASSADLPVRPKAIIAPHAGYVYSGPIAGSAYKILRGKMTGVERVVLIGPAHRMHIRGLATIGADAMATPLGNVPVDREALEEIRPFPQLQINDAAHTQEHGLEVHLPFLQVIAQDFKVVPMITGDTSAGEVAELLQVLWGGGETLIVISSDLSHFYDYDTAVKLDTATADAIVNLQTEKLRHESACGRLPIQGLLMLAKQKGLKPHLLDLRNSGDTAGSKDRVVGYGAFAFTS